MAREFVSGGNHRAARELFAGTCAKCGSRDAGSLPPQRHAARLLLRLLPGTAPQAARPAYQGRCSGCRNGQLSSSCVGRQGVIIIALLLLQSGTWLSRWS